MEIYKLIQDLKFKVEAKEYSVDLDHLLDFPTRTNILLRHIDKGFWNAFTLTTSNKECKFLMIDNIETGELYITSAPIDLILEIKDYNSSWYVVKAMISAKRNFIDIVKYIKANT